MALLLKTMATAPATAPQTVAAGPACCIAPDGYGTAHGGGWGDGYGKGTGDGGGYGNGDGRSSTEW